MIWKFFFISTVVVLLVACTIRGDRKDTEMTEIASEIYQNYLFEYGIDSELFFAHTVENCQAGIKKYKWITTSLDGLQIGVEVVVSKKRDRKPEMILIGDTDAWLPFVGSKNNKLK